MSDREARDSLQPDVVKATRPVVRGAGGGNTAPPTRLKRFWMTGITLLVVAAAMITPNPLPVSASGRPDAAV